MSNASITRFRGDDYPVKGSVTKDSSPLDLTSYTVQMSVAIDDTTTETLNGTVTDAAGGLFEIDMTTSTAKDTPGDYQYDIQINNGSYTTTIVKDMLHIVDDVTP